MDLQTIKEVCFEMLTQRGYETTEEGEVSIAIKSDDRIIIFYHTAAKLSIENIKYYTTIMNKSNFTHSIIIYEGSVTPQANKMVESFRDLNIELFGKTKLRYNITKHRLVPEHRSLVPYEAQEFKRNYGIKIPIILTTDPISRFYNFKAGDIIEIKRLDETITYRIVK